MALAIMRAGLTAADWVKHPYGGQCPRCDHFFDELWGAHSAPGPGVICWECWSVVRARWSRWYEEKEVAAKYRAACLAAVYGATDATEAAAAPRVVVPSTPGVPVDPLRRRPRLGMLRGRWQFVGLKKQLMSVNDTRREGARAVKKTFEIVKVWKRQSPGPGECREYKRVVVTQVQTTYTLAHDLSHGGICKDCDIFRGLDAQDVPRAW